MPRPTVISERQILDAARALFLEKGIRATTADVARRAGIAEGSIFKRFRTKEELFAAALHAGGNLLAPRWVEDLAAQAGRGDLRRNLAAAARRGIEFLRELLPLLMLARANPLGQDLPGLLANPEFPPAIALRRLADFFAAEAKAGRVRRHDAAVSARLFLGALQAYVFFDVLIPSRPRPVAAEIYVDEAIAVLLQGLSPPRSRATTRAGTRAAGSKR